VEDDLARVEDEGARVEDNLPPGTDDPVRDEDDVPHREDDPVRDEDGLAHAKDGLGHLEDDLGHETDDPVRAVLSHRVGVIFADLVTKGGGRAMTSLRDEVRAMGLGRDALVQQKGVHHESK
jgi:hypothetical protein